MGEIWEGYHRELDTSVAIKLVRGGGRTPELRARLGTEARALAEWLLARGVSEDSTGASLRGTWLQLPTDLAISSFPPVALSSSTSLPERAASTTPPAATNAALTAAEGSKRNARLSTGGAGAVEVGPTEDRPWTRRAKQATVAAGLMLLGLVLLTVATTSTKDRTAVSSWASVELGATPPLPRVETFMARAARACSAAVAGAARPSASTPETDAPTLPEPEAPESAHDTRGHTPSRAADATSQAIPPSVAERSARRVPPPAPAAPTGNARHELKDPYP